MERIKSNSHLSVTCVHTNQQIADIFERDKWNELRILCGIVLESCHRSSSSVIAALVSVCSQDGENTVILRESFEDRRRVIKIDSRGEKWFRRVAVRHQKSSPLISAQEVTQSDVKSRENPGQASGDRMQCTLKADK